jgi:Protein CHAPERONE-LIKE PROTEIN OF POR1-like
MSDRSPYEKLGVSEGATFEEIQSARAKLVAELAGDQRKVSEVEAAYDAVLMERLRLRQEGKIKVPEGIRFPEKSPPTTPAESPKPARSAPQWLQNLIDRPSAKEVGLPAAVMATVGTLVFFSPGAAVLQLGMAVATGSSLYFLYQKEKKLGRAVLLSLVGLVVGFALGGVLFHILITQMPGFPTGGMSNDVFVSLVTFFILWLVASFTK